MKAFVQILITLFTVLSVVGCNDNEGAYLIDINLNNPDTLEIGQSTQMEIIYVPQNAVCGLPTERPIWLSSDTSVIVIDSMGIATAKAVGDAFIKVIWGAFERDIVLSVNRTFSFSNKAFMDYCLSRYDANGDGILQGLEVTDIVGLDLTDLSIEYEPMSLQGIEAFENLQKLKISHLRIAELDLSHNKKLRDLDCSLSEISVLDISQNDKLEVLDCHGCETLSQLIIGSRTKYEANKLNTINCYRCALTDLDLTRCEALEYIDCRDNQLISLNLVNNFLITQISCSGNNISDITFPADFDFSQLKTFDKD